MAEFQSIEVMAKLVAEEAKKPNIISKTDNPETTSPILVTDTIKETIII